MDNASTTQNYKPRVLVADDSSLTRKSVQRILADDFEIIEARDGQQALGILYADEDIHAVFVDFMMPEVDGFEVLKTLRESNNLRLRKLPVIMMSSHEDGASLRRKASVLGATDFITKPFDSLLLKTRARAHARLPDDYHPSTDAPNQENKADDKTAELMEYTALEQSCPQLITDSYDQQQSVSLLYLKVDAFEALRQTTGKKEAAAVVKQTGRLIAKQLRAQDKVAPVDADDFIILLPNTDANLAKELVKLIFRAVRKSHPDLGNMRISVTLSGGMVSNGPESGYSLEKLKDIAAERLQKAVNKGGNQLVYADLKRQKIVPEKTQDISLVAALELLNEGETEAVNLQIPALLEEVFPLLVVANARLDLGIDDALRRIQARLENSKPKLNRQLH
ncbi:MAG TPA: response regulator [Chromatiales bacterium]|nr:response regulator [Thiotrichales bacterium]HIP67158.1 response regulator [Chromatiales bacterium]